MRKKNYKGRCEKRAIKKCESICKTYDPIQSAFVTILDNRDDIAEIQCNVELDGDAADFTTDIVAVMTNGELMVRECVSRKILPRPLTIKIHNSTLHSKTEQQILLDWGNIDFLS